MSNESTAPAQQPPNDLDTNEKKDDIEAAAVAPPADASEPDKEQYSVWSHNEKIAIVVLTGAASMLSTMSGQIYFPAIPAIADAFHVSIEDINLTVTSYLILQGLSPMVFGPLADVKGRRLAYIICLTILCGSCIGMAVMPQDAYWLLVLLRCVQSAGSASTVSIGFGTVTDIATPAERGTLIGIASLGPMLGPSIGPILGGVLADKFSWRGIFWFMAAFAAAVEIALILLLPETLRKIVGNGSIPPPIHLRPLFPFLRRDKPDAEPLKATPGDTSTLSALKHLNPRFLKEPDVVAILSSNACTFALFQAVSATISPLLFESYPFLTQTTVGLCFLPVGIGATIGSMVVGRIMDAEFRRFGGSRGARIPPDFPLEKARLRLVPVFLAVALAAAIIFGWTPGRASLAVPLVFNFTFGLSLVAVMNVHQAICLDLLPGQGASITAANNMFRCLLGAGIVAAVDALRRILGNGWLFVLLSGACAITVLPLITYVRVYGPRQREKRRIRKEAREAEEEEEKRRANETSA
ncbi:MFS general substrate transporter [Exidia glandulosa HHB12029]|uniref:MFS general substrate transporter n=1 Tax=Exidia glandulosa HHB12029 TaxID=1314781 RepID=A0A165ZVU2_EXIGL|nr:MFS general substrate transporter [Exidia glandulosa HHB12029]